MAVIGRSRTNGDEGGVARPGGSWKVCTQMCTSQTSARAVSLPYIGSEVAVRGGRSYLPGSRSGRINS